MSQISQYRFSNLIEKVTTDDANIVTGDANDNFNLVGAGGITTSGNPATYTVTITAGATLPTSFLTDDANSAVPALNVLTVAGGTNIGTTSAGSTVTINLDSSITVTTVNATTFDTNVAAAGVTLSGTTLQADGTDANIDINITPKGLGALVTGDIEADNIVGNGVAVGTAAAGIGMSGTSILAGGSDADISINITAKGTGTVIIDELTLTTDLAVTEGGTGASTLTDHGVLLGSGTSAITATAVGATGEIFVGSTGADAVWLTAGDANKVLTAHGAGSAVTWETPAAAGVASVTGGTNISTSGTATDPVIDLDATITLTGVNATTFDTNIVAAGVTLSGTTLSADGTDANIDINITPKGTGALVTGDIEGGSIVGTGVAVGTAAAGIGMSGTSIIAGGSDANINITLTPKGTGDLIVSVGDVSISAGNLTLPTTSSTAGQITINAVNALHMFGTNNFFAGGAGNLTLSGATDNIGIGSTALDSITSGDKNICIGSNAGTALTTQGENVIIGYNSMPLRNAPYNIAIGSSVLSSWTTSGEQNIAIGFHAMANGASIGYENLAIGISSLQYLNAAATDASYNIGIGNNTLRNLTTGRNNIAIGTDGGISPYGAGAAYTSSEHHNICIGAFGTVGDANTLRIAGDSLLSITKSYIDGIYNTTPAAATKYAVIIGSDDQLGSEQYLNVTRGGSGAGTFTDHGVLLGSGTGAFTVTAEPSNGQLLIGHTGANPVLATLTAGAGMAVTNGAGSITINRQFTINPQTDDYTLVLGDAGKFVTMDKGTANTLTVPKNASVAFPIGTIVDVYQGDTGVTTIAPVDGDVTIHSRGTLMDINGQYGVVRLVKIAENEWVLSGDRA